MINKYIERYRNTGRVDSLKPGGGRRKLSIQQQETLKQTALRFPFLTNRQLLQHIDGIPNISEVTVSRYLRNAGIHSRIAAQKPALSQRDKDIRVELATRNLNRIEDISKTVFIDEFHLETDSKAKKRVKRLVGARYDGQNIDNYCVRNRKSITAVCCFSSKGLGPIRAVLGRMNADTYLDYLRESVIPYAIENFSDDFFLLQDNAPIHTARVVTEFLIETIPGRVIEHPPYSPDLNPIENLGARFKATLRKYLRVWEVRSDFELENIARIAWRETADNEGLVASLIASMRNRYQTVINVSGNHTKY